MRQFVESLKRLYTNGEVDEKKIIELLVNNKITEEEKDYILNANAPTDEDLKVK